MTEDNKVLTLFNSGIDKRQEAIDRLYSGETPAEFVKYRPGRGGKSVPYVEGSYMTRQMSLITGFHWSHEVIETKFRPDENNPIEVGINVRIKYWDNEGKEYSHTAWGQKDVARYDSDSFKMDKGRIAKDEKGLSVFLHHKSDIISLFDDMKAAETDGIKKALSYFGIANDVYGKKELEVYSSETEGERDNKELIRRIKDIMSLDKAYEILKIQSISEVEGTIEEVIERLKGGANNTLTLTNSES